MGQLITVTEKSSARRDIVRFETNRALTGMAHERYTSLEEAEGTRPPDVLARLLFAHGGVSSITVHGNQVVVELAAGGNTSGMAELISNLFIHYKPGVTPSL